MKCLTLSIGDKASDAGLIKVRKVEEQHARQLRKIARHIGEIITGWAPRDELPRMSALPELERILASYSKALEPWAKASAARMVEEVAIRDKRAWAAYSKDMSRALRVQLESTPVGRILQAKLAEHAKAITSLPSEAAQRVYEITRKGLLTSARPAAFVEEIRHSGDVSMSRATMLARTAVSTTATELTEARALSIGSPGYWWTTAGDGDVRPSHKAMAGKFVAWDNPPTLDGYTAHAGEFANCRCRPRVSLPEW